MGQGNAQLAGNSGLSFPSECEALPLSAHLSSMTSLDRNLFNGQSKAGLLGRHAGLRCAGLRNTGSA